MPSVNDIITDRAIRHSVYLERYKTGVVNDIIALLNSSVEPKLVRQIEKELRVAAKKSPALKKLFKNNGELIKAEFGAVRSALNKKLDEIAEHEAAWQVSTLKSSTPVAIDFIMPSTAILKSIVTKKPMQGVLIKDWFSRLETNMAFKVNQQIQIGMVQGEGIEPIVRRIKGTKAAGYADGILDETRRNLRSVVRTSIAHVASNAAEASYAANDDVIKGVQIVATLDNRTTIICITQDGKVYPIGKGWRPPGHWQCRSRTVPVMKSWKELGIKLKEAPPGTRASMDGQVSAKQTYPQWLKKQPIEIQDEVLGKGKARLFRRGKVKIDRFVDRRNRPLTLVQLKRLEKNS